MKSLRVFALLWLVCSRETGAQDAPASIVLKVAIHRVQSTLHPRLQTTLSEAAIRELFNEVNTIWAQAGIRFEIAGVNTMQALDVPPKKWLERDRNWVKAALPQDKLNSEAIDVCFVGQMGPNGFFYGEPVVVSESPEFTKVKGGAANPVARVLAHELGHVLWLKHRQDHTNLMASGRNGVTLNNMEIRDARERARQISNSSAF